MNYKAIPLAGIPSGVFTSAQAEAGRTAYENTCRKCHTNTLLGRKGNKGELPPIRSLPASYQKFIGPRGFVAPLTGKVFIDRRGGKTAADETTRHRPFGNHRSGAARSCCRTRRRFRPSLNQAGFLVH